MLTPIVKVDPPAWMTADDTLAVMQALVTGGSAGEGDEPEALFVGGCVRNLLLGHLVKDIDVATVHLPETVMEILSNKGIKVIPTGLDHGTVTAVSGRQSFEITTLRRDVETDGRHADVAFTDDWVQDARRRDFTMNTLLADTDGNIYDPLGAGWHDLQMRKVVFVGDPAERIREDYLRILRFFRFYAGYGDGEPDPAALSACREAAGEMATLSRERITSEFLRLLGYEDPQPVLDIMFENKVLPGLPAAGYDPATLAMLCRLQKEHKAEHLMTRLVVLSAFRAGHLDTLAKYLVLSNEQKRVFKTVIAAVSDLDTLSEKEIKKLIYNYNSNIALQSVLLFVAWENQEKPETIALIKSWQPPEFPVNGDDVKSLGVEEGPDIGTYLARVEAWWIDKDFKPDRQACRSYLKKIV